VPDRTFLQRFDGPVVTFVWVDPAQPTEPEMVLQQMGPTALVWKMAPVTIEETRVGSANAIWTEGPYLLDFKNGDTRQQRIVHGRVLIWQEGEVTYRLESRLAMTDAVALAESLQPLDLEATE
jgi:hypothetical protein